MSKVVSLGHVGISVRDLDVMVDFYTRVLGLTATDEIPGVGVFLSARPAEEHHEILLTRGEEPTNAQQISFPVATLDDLRELYHAVRDAGGTDFTITNHGIALGCYFRDPEQNRLEIYWPTGIDYPQPQAQDVDLDASDEEILRQIDGLPPREGSEPHHYGRDVGKRQTGTAAP